MNLNSTYQNLTDDELDAINVAFTVEDDNDQTAYLGIGSFMEDALVRIDVDNEDGGPKRYMSPEVAKAFANALIARANAVIAQRDKREARR